MRWLCTVKIIAVLMTVGLVSACITTKGTYSIKAYDASGREFSEDVKLFAFGSGIYSSISALCIVHPKAIVIVRDVETGKQLESESPHQCR
jgi:hypothetical protein